MTAAPGQLEGYIIDLLDEVSANASIDFTAVPVADGKYGSRDEKGDWNGMIAELKHDVCELLLIRRETPFLITKI